MNLNNKNIFLTGGSSMIGSAVYRILQNRDCLNIRAPSHTDCNLLKYQDILDHLGYRPDCLIHCAGWNGGIEWNRRFPAEIFWRTTQMALNVLCAAKTVGITKVVSIISSCAYPDIGETVLVEENLWDGEPNTSVECHGFSKRMLNAYSRTIYQQYGFHYVQCVLTNAYGPNDSYHPAKTKVIGALIRKFVEAQYNNISKVVCWGTGCPLREFIYADDAAEAIIQVAEKYDNVEYPINIGSGQEISIKDLTLRIANLVGYTGEIVWDLTKPDGQYRKRLDITKMKTYIDLNITDLNDGLRETIEWYKNNKIYADAQGLKV